MGRRFIIEGELDDTEFFKLIQKAENIDFNGELEFETSRLEKINLTNCTFDKLRIIGETLIPITLNNCECNEIFISGSVGEILIYRLKKCAKIEFDKIHTDKFTIRNSEFDRLAFSYKGQGGYIKEGEVSDCIVSKELIANVEMNLLNVRGKNRINSFGIGTGVKHCSIFEGGNQIQTKVRGLSLDIGTECSVFISKLQIDSMVCRFKGDKSSLAVHNSNVNSFYFWPHKNMHFGKIHLESCNAINSITIDKGGLEKVYLCNLELTKSHIDFRNLIENEEFTWDNISWPTEILNYLNINGYDDGRKTIRGLKQKAKIIDDKFSALLFNSLELKHRFESLREKQWPPDLRKYIGKPGPPKYKVIAIKTFFWIVNPFSDLYFVLFRKRINFSLQDRLSLYISKYSNNFGIDWIRALLFTSIGAGLIFYFYCLSLSPGPYVLGWNGWSEYWNIFNDNFKHFTHFLNPTHNFDFMKTYEINSIASFWDFLGRIYISFGYYQIIKSFRKLF